MEAMGSGQGHGQHVGEVSALHINVASFPGSSPEKHEEPGNEATSVYLYLCLERGGCRSSLTLQRVRDDLAQYWIR